MDATLLPSRKRCYVGSAERKDTIPLNCLYDILLLVLLIIKTDIVNVVRIIASYKRSEHFKGYFLTNEFF